MTKLLLITLLLLSSAAFSQTNKVCFITNFQTNVGPCDTNDTYKITGSIEFVGEPITGTLTITDDCSGLDTIINAPFTSPQSWGIHNIPTTFQGSCNVTAVFSADTTCNISINYNAPQPCNCVAQIGTFTANITPNTGQTPYQLCFGDQFTLTANGGFVAPDSVDQFQAYNPGIGYLLYSCPPTIAVNPSNTFPNNNIVNDPCFVGLIGTGSSFSDINILGEPTWPWSWTDNTIYVVPITFYDTVGLIYSYVNSPNLPCYEMGQPYAVQYLPQIAYSETPNCYDSSITFTLYGGLPNIDSSLYTVSNLSPANLNFINTSTTDSGTIMINGFLNGDNYSFDVTDTNGCVTVISGGPFLGLPNVSMTPFNPDTICQWDLPFILNNGSPVGGNYYGVDVTDSLFNPSSIGLYTIYYSFTDTNNNCTSIDSAQIYSTFCTGINEYEDADFSVYPNPVKNQLFISTSLSKFNLELLDVTGKVLKSYTSRKKVIDVSNLSSGVYFIHFYSDKKIITRKFIKH